MAWMIILIAFLLIRSGRLIPGAPMALSSLLFHYSMVTPLLMSGALELLSTISKRWPAKLSIRNLIFLLLAAIICSGFFVWLTSSGLFDYLVIKNENYTSTSLPSTLAIDICFNSHSSARACIYSHKKILKASCTGHASFMPFCANAYRS
jgi:hypothetical protein